MVLEPAAWPILTEPSSELSAPDDVAVVFLPVEEPAGRAQETETGIIGPAGDGLQDVWEEAQLVPHHAEAPQLVHAGQPAGGEGRQLQVAEGAEETAVTQLKPPELGTDNARRLVGTLQHQVRSPVPGGGQLLLQGDHVTGRDRGCHQFHGSRLKYLEQLLQAWCYTAIGLKLILMPCRYTQILVDA